MKSKLVIGILVAVILLCQGLVFAESADKVTATAENVVAVTSDSATGAVEEKTVVAGEVSPGVVPVKDATAVAKKEVKEETKM